MTDAMKEAARLINAKFYMSVKHLSFIRDFYGEEDLGWRIEVAIGRFHRRTGNPIQGTDKLWGGGDTLEEAVNDILRKK
jgi:hypothetical protein